MTIKQLNGPHGNYERHPISALFDVFDDDDLSDLTESIKKVGVIQSIVLSDGMVIDGWNRYRIARDLGIRADLRELTPEVDPRDFVKALNIARRHLTKSQKATMVVRLNEWRPVGVQDDRTNEDDQQQTATEEQMASQAGVSKKTIQQAKQAESAGKGDEVLSGKKSLQAVVDEIKQEEVEEPGDDDAPSVAPAVKPARPRKPSATDKLKSQLRERDETIASQSEEISNLKVVLKGYELEIEGDHDGALREMNNLQAQIRSLKGSLGQTQTKLGDCKRRCKALEKQVAELQSQLSAGDAADDDDSPPDVDEEDVWED